MKRFFVATLLALLPLVSGAVLPHVGFYQTIDDEMGLPKSIVRLYEYLDDDDVQVAGRIVALYDTNGFVSETLSAPSRVAERVKGQPKMVGLDIIWDMEWDSDDNKYEDGKIMDPKSGKVYSSVMWQDAPSVLNVRGKIGPFGRTQRWNVLSEDALPSDLQSVDVSGWKPVVRK